MSSFELLGVFTPAQKAFVRGWWKRVTVAHPKARNFQEMKVPTVDKGVFGIPLVESIKYAHSNISYIDDETKSQCFGYIPTIVAKCGSFLKEEALTTEGIFRICGSTRRIRMLQSIFDSPELYGSQLDWRGYTVHDAANVMKRFLNFLPEPVITLEYYFIFKNTTLAEYPTLDLKIKAIQEIIAKLPTAHQYLLLYMLDLLSMFATAVDYTRMNVECLSAVFAPGMLSHPNDQLNPAAYLESQKVLSFLIEHQDQFLMPSAQDQADGIAVTTNVPQKSFCIIKRHGSEDNKSLITSDRSFMSYSITAGSGMQPINLEAGKTQQSRVTLRRCKTEPSRRNKFGSYEPQQVVFVNRTPSQGSRQGTKFPSTYS